MHIVVNNNWNNEKKECELKIIIHGLFVQIKSINSTASIYFAIKLINRRMNLTSSTSSIKYAVHWQVSIISFFACLEYVNRLALLIFRIN